MEVVVVLELVEGVAMVVDVMLQLKVGKMVPMVEHLLE